VTKTNKRVRLARSFGTSSVPRSVLPYHIIRPLRYVDYGTLTCAGAGAVTALEYLVNSCYDPHYTGGGHQPYMFDQFAQLYTQYRVHRAKITFRLATDKYDQQAILASLGPRLAGTASSLSNFIPFAEFPQSVTHVVSSGANETVLSFEADIWDMLGVTKQRYLSDPSYLESMSASPAVYALCTLLYWSADTSATPRMAWVLDLQMMVELTGLAPQGYS
jgi:hypothetical protein